MDIWLQSTWKQKRKDNKKKNSNINRPGHITNVVVIHIIIVVLYCNQKLTKVGQHFYELLLLLFCHSLLQKIYLVLLQLQPTMYHERIFVLAMLHLLLFHSYYNNNIKTFSTTLFTPSTVNSNLCFNYCHDVLNVVFLGQL